MDKKGGKVIDKKGGKVTNKVINEKSEKKEKSD